MVQLLETPKKKINLKFNNGYFHAANVNQQHTTVYHNSTPIATFCKTDGLSNKDGANLFLQALNIQQQYPFSQLEELKSFIDQVLNLTDHFVSNRDSEEAMVLREIHQKANELINSFKEVEHV